MSKVIFLHCLEVRLSIWFLHIHCMMNFISLEFGAHLLAVSVLHYHHSPFESGLQITGFSNTFFMSSSAFTPFFPFIILINPL